MNKFTTFDPTYSLRHNKRNIRRVKSIIKHIKKAGEVLDIGCNKGYISKALLQEGGATNVQAIEMSASVVDPYLQNNSHFSLYVGDVCNFTFNRTYNTIIYTAVHHHVLGTKGPTVAMNLWNNIISHCNEILVFETGLIEEKGDYYWKKAIRNNFMNDETYLRSLLLAIGPRLRTVSRIAAEPIHGIRRPLFLFQLWPVGGDFDIHADKKFYGDLYQQTDNWVVEKKFFRTVGQKTQKLVEKKCDLEKTVGNVYRDTEFRLLRNKKTGAHAFSKKILFNEFKEMREFRVSQTINHKHIVKVYAVSPDHGLIFPYYKWQTLPDADLSTVENIEEIRHEIIDIFHFADKTEVDIGILDLGIAFEKKLKPRRLSDIIDMHARNFLVEVKDNTISNWVLVDLECFSYKNRNRNIANKKEVLKYLMKQDTKPRKWLRKG